MIMTQYDVYRYYLALKLHFTTDNYDVIKNQGRIKASKQAFAKRKDLYSIAKIAKSFSEKEVVDFLVANFVSGDRWGGIFDNNSKDCYLEWKKRIESLQYNFTKDLDNLIIFCEINNISFEQLFYVSKNEHPYIIKEYLRKNISIETMVILDKLLNYTEKFDLDLDDKIIWPNISRIIKKYKPFLKINKENYNGIFRRRIGSTIAEN